MTRRGGRPRPTKAARSVAASAGTLALWAAVAHNSGSGWVQALGCLLAGFVVLGLLGPAVATARLRAEVESNPTDATVGQPVRVLLRANAPLRASPVAPDANPDEGAGVVAVEIVPERRGALDEITVWLSSAAPFGVLWWRKRAVLRLARPLWVAPVPGAPDAALIAGNSVGGTFDPMRPSDARFGEPRGVRPYVAGDPRRLVHWSATAHHGQLMVRESERPDQRLIEVVVRLPDVGAAGDLVAGRALGTLFSLLEHSSPVLLSTLEAHGARSEAVYGPTDARRRLARAVASTARER
ncbi:MAG: DUF58 domain-containing protein [Acidimicrobiales bacterium]